MRPFFLTSLLLFFVTSGCAEDEPVWANTTPNAEQIKRLERKLSNEECIGDLSFWERRYSFWVERNHRSPTYGKINQDLIVFTLRKGTVDYPIKPNRIVRTANPRIIDLDHRRGQFALGEFNLASDDLNMESCFYEQGDV